MVLALDNRDVQRLLDMGRCISALDEAYRDLGAGAAVTSPRIDLLTPDSHVDADGAVLPGCHMLKTMSAATRKYAAIRFLTDKVFWRERDGVFRRERTPGTRRAHSVTRGLILLFGVEDGDLLALVSEGHIRNLRVGAAAALAARHLAGARSATVGLLGTGFMARAHLDALRTARNIESVRVFSPNPLHRQRFVQELETDGSLDAAAVDAPEEAVRGSEIVVLATNSLAPVIERDWLEPGMYVCSVRHCEIAPGAFRGFDVLAVNSRDNLGPDTFISRSREEPFPEEVKLDIEKGYPPGDAVEVDWRNVPDLPDLLSGRHPGRTDPAQVTCFDNSVGFGLQFAAVAGTVYEAALSRGVGRELPNDCFPDLF